MLADIVIVTETSILVGIYGIPPRGGYYWLAGNWSECGYCDTEEEAKAELQRYWEE